MRLSLVLVLLAALIAGGCQGITPAPYKEGTWCGAGHVHMSWDNLEEDTTPKNEVDINTFAGDVGAGYFVTPEFSVQGYVAYSDSKTEANSVTVSEQTTWDILLGGRYHFMHSGNSRPWVEILFGFSQLDFGSGVDDTAFVYGAAAGWTEFVTNSTALELMFRYTMATYELTTGIDTDRTRYGFWLGWVVYW